ncbi:nitrilase family protein [Flavobacterium restrictum]|uniref:Omega-amidase YafV n=1 Tax=Flavobacterium restrictum TaxID=2594428 RepID=A0A553DR53_9FLAO|nr:nitrilase family protein [Flavobacterium restrictum]TRX35261.1 nitrilase family protein [Flavobacterium restrictum]
MKIALIQTQLYWENPTKNRNHFEEKINAITEQVDLIVLPEMFTTGFTMRPNHVAETMQGETITWLKVLAKAKNSAITGSLAITEKDSFYNRLVFVFPSGEIKFYDKRHLFSLAGEDKTYTSGNQKLIVEYLGWKICPLICYDLRFPVFARNVEDYDILIYVANWPKIRINAWDILLQARSVENMCYTIGVNRTGFDNTNYEHNGHSQAVDFMGNYIVEPQETEDVFMLDLNKEKLLTARKKLNFLSDKDTFEIKKE